LKKTLNEDKKSFVVVARPFESGLFGGPVYEVKIQSAIGFESQALLTVLNHVKKNNPRLIWCKFFPYQLNSLARDVLSRENFRSVETLCTLKKSIETSDDSHIAEVGLTAVREAVKDDADAVGCIGERAFQYDRFHKDPKISNQIADSLKREWARNAVLGRADKVYIYEDRDGLHGFCACMLAGDRAIIDLIAVRPESRGRGIGGILLDKVCRSYRRDLLEIYVGTQLKNQASLKMYVGRGFEHVTQQETFHWTAGV
jgi:ribosomal protein S18 acetylase RimI-like enzyme